MAEMKENILDKIIKNTERVTPNDIPLRVSKFLRGGVGIIEAVSQVFWAAVKDGQIVPMSDAKKDQASPSKWITARFFNEDVELRFQRKDNNFLMTCFSDKEAELTESNYRDTQWLLSGRKISQQGLEQEMSEFQVAAYRMPISGGNLASCIKVRQYIDYEPETGLAKIVAERFVKIGEEKNNG